MPYVLPDLLGAVRTYLSGHADVVALTPRVHVLRMPADPVFPLVLLTSVVESPLIGVSDKFAGTEVQVECYGSNLTDEYAARTLAATCHAALTALNSSPSDGMIAAESLTGLQPVPDTTIDKARWLFDVRVYGYS